MTHLSLFSGIGGIDLAAHWAGFTTVAFVEKEPYCKSVLAKSFPGVPIYEDVTTFTAKPFRGCALVSGGVPCQGISRANRHAKGLDDPRSGLWSEMRRVVGECLPLRVLVENSPSIVDRGYVQIKSDLESLGYEVDEPVVLAAFDVGLPQERARAFIVARLDEVGGREALQPAWNRSVPHDERRDVQKSEPRWHNLVLRFDANLGEVVRSDGTRASFNLLDRMSDGVPNRLDRLRALGNAVVPQQVYPILKAIADQITEEGERG